MASNPSVLEGPNALAQARESAATVHSLPNRDMAADAWIAVIDCRPSRREFVCNFLSGQACLRARILPVDVDELLRERGPAHEPSMLIFSVGGLSVSDPLVSTDFERLLGRYDDVPLVVLSDLDAREEAQLALAAGAAGFVPTLLDPQLMCAALMLMQSGGKFAPPALFDEWVHATLPARSDDGEEQAQDLVPQYDELTPRQTHVLQLLQEGHANKVIASKLGMTESTVKVHVRQIMRRLGANNRTEAALLAQRHQEALRRRAS
jgi:DNA-binding NarL/FixJ family response regulator